jgi:hypothetical protein
VRRLTAVVLCALAFGGLGAQAAMADPNPDTNKNAVIVTFTCGEDAVEVVTILQNAALAVQLVDGSGVLVLVHVTLVDKTTGDVLFEFDVPGFDHNKQETTTCTATNPLFPNALQIMEVVSRPA